MKKLLIGALLVVFVVSLFATAAAGWKRYDGVTLNWLVQTGHNAWIVHVHKDAVEKELGI